jgi:hypothetical protein
VIFLNLMEYIPLCLWNVQKQIFYYAVEPGYLLFRNSYTFRSFKMYGWPDNGRKRAKHVAASKKKR